MVLLLFCAGMRIYNNLLVQQGKVNRFNPVFRMVQYSTAGIKFLGIDYSVKAVYRGVSGMVYRMRPGSILIFYEPSLLGVFSQRKIRIGGIFNF